MLIHFILICVILITVLYGLIGLYRNRTAQNESKWIVTYGFIVVITTINFLCTSITYHIIGECYTYYYTYSGLALFIDLMYIANLGIQGFFCIIVFFERLRTLFIATTYELSKITIKIYHVSFILMPIHAVISIIIFTVSSYSISIITFSIFVLWIMILMITLVFLYISKLIQAYKSTPSGNPNDKLITRMSKISILTLLSIFTMIIHVISIGIWRDGGNWIVGYVTLLDTYTNFLAVVLCFKSFADEYDIICGCSDKICNKCWLCCIHNHEIKRSSKDSKQLEQYVKNKKAPSGHIEIQPTSPGD